jgi:hypothetical protein
MLNGQLICNGTTLENQGPSMYRKVFIGAVLVVALPMLSLADEPASGELPPDYGPPISPPPPPPEGKPASGWIFLSHPHHYRTPLYYLGDRRSDDPTVSILVTLKGNVRNVHQAAVRAFERTPRVDLSIKDSPLGQFIAIASGDIVPIAGRLVKFERGEFPADYPQASIPKNVMDRGLLWTDVTDSVPAEVRPGKGWPLVLATSNPEKQSGQHRFDYKLFPDPNSNKGEFNKRPFYVKVMDITSQAKNGAKSQAEIELIARISPLQRKTVRTFSVQIGESIEHDGRAHRVLQIVPRQKIEGIGNLIGWIEVEP